MKRSSRRNAALEQHKGRRITHALLLLSLLLLLALPFNIFASGPNLLEEPAPEETDTGSISGYLWVDGNGSLSTDWNGKHDSGEMPLANYTVSLYTADDKTTPFAQTQTDEDGNYSFDELEPGSYIVGLTSGTVNGVEYLLPMAKTNLSVFTINWSASPIAAYSDTIEVDAGTVTENINAGMRLPMGFKPLAVVLTKNYRVYGNNDGSDTNPVYDSDDLADAVNWINSDPWTMYTIIVSNKSDTNISSFTLNTGKNVKMRSITGKTFTLTKVGIGRHGIVNGNLTLTNIILDGNKVGGGLKTESKTATLTIGAGVVIQNCVGIAPVGDGGGIDMNGGTLNLDGGIIKDNLARANGAGQGGGVCVTAATFYMYSGQIIGNTARKGSDPGNAAGGGVVVNRNEITKETSTFYMYGGTISNNVANAENMANTGNFVTGGGVYVANDCVFTMSGGTISGNIANTGSVRGASGGGVYVQPGATFTMTDGTISNNIGSTVSGGLGNGGGVNVNGGTFTMSGGTISNNTTCTAAPYNGDGGGVWVNWDAVDNNKKAYFYITGAAQIIDNSAPNGVGGGIYTGNCIYSDPASVTSYANIGIAKSATISGNTARATVMAPSNDAGFTNRSVDPFDGMLLTNDQINYYNTTYRIIYYANDGSGSGANCVYSHTLAPATIYTQAQAGFSPPTNMAFTGWNTAADNSGTPYTVGQGITIPAVGLRLYAQWAIPLTTLSVSKTVDGAYGDRTKEFTFKITLEYENGAPLAGPVNTLGGSIVAGVAAPPGGPLDLDSNGSAEFTLSHGQTLSFQNVPANGMVQIEETEDGNYRTSFIDSDDMNVTFSKRDTTLLPMSANRNFAFTNNRIEVVPNGIVLGNTEAMLPLILLALLSIPALLAAKVVSRRNKRGDLQWS